MRNKILLILIISLALGSAFTACSKKPSPDDRVLAKVSNKSVTLDDFKSKIAKMPAYYRNIIERNKKRYLEEVIAEMLFYEDAIRKGIDKDREVREVINEARKKIVITKYIKNEVEDNIKVGEDEMKEFYEEHKGEFKTPALWRASHILVAAEREAKEIQDELSKGASFEELARKRSIDATASRGGDIGYFRQGQLVGDFETQAMKLEVGEVSGIIHTQFGYHIIKLVNKKEPVVQGYDEAKRVIESELKKKRRSELFDVLVQNLKDRYGVEIKEDVFKSLD